QAAARPFQAAAHPFLAAARPFPVAGFPTTNELTSPRRRFHPAARSSPRTVGRLENNNRAVVAQPQRGFLCTVPFARSYGNRPRIFFAFMTRSTPIAIAEVRWEILCSFARRIT